MIRFFETSVEVLNEVAKAGTFAEVEPRSLNDVDGFEVNLLPKGTPMPLGGLTCKYQITGIEGDTLMLLGKTVMTVKDIGQGYLDLYQVREY